MNQRTVSTPAALRAAHTMKAVVQGDLEAHAQEVLAQLRVLGDARVWDGAAADQFRRVHLPQSQATMRRTLECASELNAHVTRVIGDIMGAGAASLGPTGHVGLSSPPPPPPGTSAQGVRAWWESLSYDQQQQEIQQHPAAIGSLNGIPAASRDQANRLVLAARIHDLQASGADPETLAALKALQSRLDRQQPPAYLMGFDPAHGRVIVAINNPDFADNVVTMVPGGTLPKDAPGNIGWADNVVTAAGRAGPSQSTSAIMWMDYDSPSNGGFWNAINKEDASVPGAKALDAFQQGLRVTHEQRPDGLPLHMVLAGHSYGTVVVGESSRQPGYQAPDDVILTAGPGVGVGSVGDLHVPPSGGRPHVWSGEAGLLDPGTLGSGLVGDGGTIFGDGAELFKTSPFDSHDDYYMHPDSIDMKNIGDIVVGNYDAVQVDSVNN